MTLLILGLVLLSLIIYSFSDAFVRKSYLFSFGYHPISYGQVLMNVFRTMTVFIPVKEKSQYDENNRSRCGSVRFLLVSILRAISSNFNCTYITF